MPRKAQRIRHKPSRQPRTTKQPASASTAAAAPPKRTLRQTSRHSEKPALALMTLRTIEFPDGRRATQLIPYHGERALDD
jgi:hypothetical protein